MQPYSILGCSRTTVMWYVGYGPKLIIIIKGETFRPQSRPPGKGPYGNYSRISGYPIFFLDKSLNNLSDTILFEEYKR